MLRTIASKRDQIHYIWYKHIVFELLCAQIYVIESKYEGEIKSIQIFPLLIIAVNCLKWKDLLRVDKSKGPFDWFDDCIKCLNGFL